MKCECGNSISLLDIILPWRTSYVLNVVDDDFNTVEKVRVCKSCGKKWTLIEQLIFKEGTKSVEKILHENTNVTK